MKGAPLLSHERGTMRGYRWHAKTGTVPCTSCLLAHCAESQWYRDQGKCAPGLGWPLEVPGSRPPR